MSKFDAEVIELKEAYRINKIANAAIRTEVREKYKEVIAQEIKERKLANDVKFARRLAEVKERSGMTVSAIQDEVFGSRTWSRWEYWRDLMGILPERESTEKVRAAKRGTEKPYRIEDGVVIVTRNADGPVEEFRIENVDVSQTGVYVFWPYLDGEEHDRAKTAFPGNVMGVSTFLNGAFEKYGDNPQDLVAEREEN